MVFRGILMWVSSINLVVLGSICVGFVGHFCLGFGEILASGLRDFCMGFGGIVLWGLGLV